VGRLYRLQIFSNSNVTHYAVLTKQIAISTVRYESLTILFWRGKAPFHCTDNGGGTAQQ